MFRHDYTKHPAHKGDSDRKIPLFFADLVWYSEMYGLSRFHVNLE